MMAPTLWFAAGVATAFALALAAAKAGHWLRRRRDKDDQPTIAGHWECPHCAVEVPLAVAGRTVVLELDTTDAELHEMTHEGTP